MNNILLNEELYSDLPSEIQELLAGFEKREKDIAFLSTIGVLSCCFPKVYGIYDGKEVYPNLYVMVIAPPASGKGVLNYSRLLIEPIHRKVYKDSLSEIQKWKKEKKNKKNDEPCPSLSLKIIPGNISAAEMYPSIKNSHCGGVIIESEADTLSVMLNQDWGNFSDILRKAFHHEPISISRKMDNLYLDIEMPQLSLVLSGTSDQLHGLVKSKENGLFSRMIFYFFNEVSNWKDVFDRHKRNYTDNYKVVGVEIFKLYQKLVNREVRLEFRFTKEQEIRFNSEMKKIFDIIATNYSANFTSNVKRHGLIMFRICMILTSYRNKENLESIKILECTDTDFNTSLGLTKQLLYHSHAVSENISLGGLSDLDDRFLFSLKAIFSRNEAIVIGNNLGFSNRSVDEKLKKWRHAKILRKIAHGKYKRNIG